MLAQIRFNCAINDPLVFQVYYALSCLAGSKIILSKICFKINLDLIKMKITFNLTTAELAKNVFKMFTNL